MDDTTKSGGASSEGFVEFRCPFCGEGDFDIYGLKYHFTRGWCDVMEALPEPARYGAAIASSGTQDVGGE